MKWRACACCGASFPAKSDYEPCAGCGAGPNILGTKKIGIKQPKTNKVILYCILAPLMLISLILAPMFDYDI